jgi:hypothetical protein
MNERLTWFGIGCSGAIERRLQPGDKTLAAFLRRPGPALRRHHSGAQLHHHLFPDFSSGRNVGDVKAIERQFGGLHALVVAADAVLVEERASV